MLTYPKDVLAGGRNIDVGVGGDVQVGVILEGFQEGGGGRHGVLIHITFAWGDIFHTELINKGNF